MTTGALPFNIPAESSLLGAMLLSEDAVFAAIKSGLNVSDFAKPTHQTICEVIFELRGEGTPIDQVTVAGRLDRMGRLSDVGGLEYLTEMTVTLPSVSGAARYAKDVIDTAIMRDTIHLAAQISDIGYTSLDVDRSLAEISGAVRGLINAADRQLLHGYYDDSRLLNTDTDRDAEQPWIARGVLRRQQRCLIVARAGIGKSVLLRQMAMCCANGVHPYTGQPTEVPREALIVELEAGEWDISSSLTKIAFALQRVFSFPSVQDVTWPALLHRPGGLDLRTPAGYATLEAAIRRAEPQLVVIGPLKYLSVAKPGENYEIAALNLMAILNDLMERYRFGLVMEAHFSRGDRGAPGGSERWVDWPDAGYGIHPPSDDITVPLGEGAEMTVKRFRHPRDEHIWIPTQLLRGEPNSLPWLVPDHPDPYRYGSHIYASRYGGMPATVYTQNIQGEF